MQSQRCRWVGTQTNHLQSLCPSSFSKQCQRVRPRQPRLLVWTLGGSHFVNLSSAGGSKTLSLANLHRLLSALHFRIARVSSHLLEAAETRLEFDAPRVLFNTPELCYNLKPLQSSLQDCSQRHGEHQGEHRLARPEDQHGGIIPIEFQWGRCRLEFICYFRWRG